MADGQGSAFSINNHVTYSERHRCGHDGQRKRVAHTPTATTTEDSLSKLIQNHPHDFTKSLNKIQSIPLVTVNGSFTRKQKVEGTSQ
jgi:hypothetical protein